MCPNRHKNNGCGQQKPEGTSSVMFEVGTVAKCCEFKRYVLRIDSMFSPGKTCSVVAKTMVMEKKTDQKALALLCLA